MDLQTDRRTDRLRARARWAAFACRLSACAIPALLLASWVLGEASAAARAQLGLAPDMVLTTFQRVGAAALSLLPTLALARSLLSIAVCFDGVARGDWFGARQPRALAVAGRWLVVAGVLSLVVPTLLGLLLTLNAAPGARMLVIALSSHGVLGVLFGTLLWSLGHLWAMAHNIAAENARFV